MVYKPTLGGNANANFPLQFPHSTLTGASLCCTLIILLSNDGLDNEILHASGFFWRFENNVYLISARHVISGLNPFDDSIVSKKGYIPEKIRVYPTRTMPNGTAQRTGPVDIQISQKPRNWLQDPDFDSLRTDIAAVLLDVEEPERVACLNDIKDNNHQLVSLVGMDCSIVGYPTSNFGDLRTPIWRRGTFASEPLLPIDKKPMFLVDASTSRGFSGSPVFRLHFGPAPVYNSDGKTDLLVDRIRTISFIGVYAGRIDNTHVGGEVPFVFYANRIPLLFHS